MLESSRVARGAVLLSAVQLLFLATAYVIQVFLARILGPTDYGSYGTVLSVLSVGLLVVSSGIPYAISKRVSENISAARSIRNKGLQLETALILVCCAAYIAISSALGQVFNDESLVLLFQVAVLTLPTYGIYSVISFYLNGRQEFGKQTAAQTAYYIARVALIIGFVISGFHLVGALIGNALAPIVGLLAAYMLIEREEEIPVEEESLDNSYDLVRSLLAFAVPATAFVVFLTLLSNIDIWAVKALIPLNPETAGYYNAAYQFARIPLYVGQALVIVLFPALSKMISSGDKQNVQRYVDMGLRYMGVMASIVFLLVGAFSTELIDFMYGQAYSPSTPILVILVAALSVQAMLGLCLSILSSGDYPQTATFLCVILVTIQILLLFLLVPSLGMTGAALSTLAISVVGFLMALTVIRKKISSSLPIKSLLAIGVPALVVGSILVVITPILSEMSLLVSVLIRTMILALYVGFLLQLRVVSIRALVEAVVNRDS